MSRSELGRRSCGESGFVFVQAPQMRATLGDGACRIGTRSPRAGTISGSTPTWPMAAATGSGGTRRSAPGRTGSARKPHQPHYQSRDYNALNGGIARWFEPVLEHDGGDQLVPGDPAVLQRAVQRADPGAVLACRGAPVPHRGAARPGRAADAGGDASGRGGLGAGADGRPGQHRRGHDQHPRHGPGACWAASRLRNRWIRRWWTITASFTG